MLPGDGVGPELMMAVKEVFKVNVKCFRMSTDIVLKEQKLINTVQTVPFF